MCPLVSTACLCIRLFFFFVVHRSYGFTNPLFPYSSTLSCINALTIFVVYHVYIFFLSSGLRLSFILKFLFDSSFQVLLYFLNIWGLSSHALDVRGYNNYLIFFWVFLLITWFDDFQFAFISEVNRISIVTTERGCRGYKIKVSTRPGPVRHGPDRTGNRSRFREASNFFISSPNELKFCTVVEQALLNASLPASKLLSLKNFTRFSKNFSGWNFQKKSASSHVS